MSPELIKLFSELIKSQSFWGVFGSVVGVILGFLIGEGSRVFRYRWRICKLKHLVKEELRSILKQIPQKKEIVSQIITTLDLGRYLPGVSVRIMNTGYKQFISELYEHLIDLQRNCLHVIHENLNVAEETLSSFERDFLTALEKGVIDNPYAAYKTRFQEILESYDIVVELIESYLKGNPTDVFYIKNVEKKKLNQTSYGTEVTRKINF